MKPILALLVFLPLSCAAQPVFFDTTHSVPSFSLDDPATTTITRQGAPPTTRTVRTITGFIEQRSPVNPVQSSNGNWDKPTRLPNKEVVRVEITSGTQVLESRTEIVDSQTTPTSAELEPVLTSLSDNSLTKFTAKTKLRSVSLPDGIAGKRNPKPLKCSSGHTEIELVERLQMKDAVILVFRCRVDGERMWSRK